MSASDIKSMKLYSHLERITNELVAAGLDPEGPLTVADLSPFDNLHYHGTDAVERAIVELGLSADSKVAEVGSGLGGPARYMAERSGCHVTALELQADLNDTARALTQRSGLDALVTHIQGNVLAGDVPADAFTGLVSMLCFLHIPRIVRELCEVASPGGDDLRR